MRIKTAAEIKAIASRLPSDANVSEENLYGDLNPDYDPNPEPDSIYRTPDGNIGIHRRGVNIEFKRNQMIHIIERATELLKEDAITA